MQVDVGVKTQAQFWWVHSEANNEAIIEEKCESYYQNAGPRYNFQMNKQLVKDDMKDDRYDEGWLILVPNWVVIFEEGCRLVVGEKD